MPIHVKIVYNKVDERWRKNEKLILQVVDLFG